ncbi:MAG TPA: hypothetical protein VFB54_05470 [Burkholderiales bacterium]|nr:hypothetical protein [Burkholderiales bacterium]
MLRLTTRLHVPAFLTLVATSALVSVADAAECRSVRGVIEETQVTGPDCTSPVGLCTVSQLFGPLKGQAHFTAAQFIQSADTPTTGVVFVIGDTTLNARLGNKRGTLSIKDAAAFRTTGEGDLTDLQVITGGTGDFIGASGALRLSGNFASGSGTSSFEGTICLP